MQLASDEGISVTEGMGTKQGTFDNEEDAAANKEGTAANDHAPANETPPQPCQAEALRSQHLKCPHTLCQQQEKSWCLQAYRQHPH